MYKAISFHAVSCCVSESDPCTPNPCLHNSVCVPAGNGFSCDCSGTKYTGVTCNIGIILLPPIPVLTKGQTHDITISTDLSIPSTIRLLLFENGDALRPILVLRARQQLITLQYTPNEAGIHTITREHDKKDLFVVEPSTITVLVRETSEQSAPTNHYFTTLGLRVSQLKESCCLPQDHSSFSCPESTDQVTLKAACQWKNDGTTHWAPGVIFADGHNLSLPVSVAGYQYSQDGEGSVLTATSECTPCNPTEPVCMQQTSLDNDCYCYNFTGQDTQDFLNTRALGLTYIEQIQSLLPTWLKLQGAIPKSTTTQSEHDYLAPIVQSHVDIKAIEGCNEITPTTHGIYSVLRYASTLSGEIDGQTYTYNNTKGSSDPLCFAVNLCQGKESPVFMQLSQTIQNIVVSEHLRRFVDKGWEIQLNTVMVSRSQIVTTINHAFWNGIKSVIPPLIKFDVRVTICIEAVFRSENIKMNVTFKGYANLQYQVRLI